jgi:hypothetical protein
MHFADLFSEDFQLLDKFEDAKKETFTDLFTQHNVDNVSSKLECDWLLPVSQLQEAVTACEIVVHGSNALSPYFPTCLLREIALYIMSAIDSEREARKGIHCIFNIRSGCRPMIDSLYEVVATSESVTFQYGPGSAHGTQGSFTPLRSWIPYRALKTKDEKNVLKLMKDVVKLKEFYSSFYSMALNTDLW